MLGLLIGGEVEGISVEVGIHKVVGVLRKEVGGTEGLDETSTEVVGDGLGEAEVKDAKECVITKVRDLALLEDITKVEDIMDATGEVTCVSIAVTQDVTITLVQI